MPAPSPDTPLGTLVSDRPARSRVFEALGIDYCCRGDRTLAEACRGRDLDPDTAAQMLDAAAEAGGPREETSWAGAMLEATIQGLRDLEEDMHRHVHEENNVLFPRARDLIRGGADAA